uniref:Uncharacterized protein n=1 Tax=Kalanchoe fedtschenkoi TaxID=63787 RepID=A0A7N0RBD3_KALFE
MEIWRYKIVSHCHIFLNCQTNHDQIHTSQLPSYLPSLTEKNLFSIYTEANWVEQFAAAVGDALRKNNSVMTASVGRWQDKTVDEEFRIGICSYLPPRTSCNF